MSSRNRVLAGCLALLTLVAAACGGGGKGGDVADPGSGDDSILRVAIGAEPGQLDPHLMAVGADNFATWNMVERLIERDIEGNLVPALATEWEVSPDGREFTFTLREDVLFHNGETMTPEDVKFSVDNYANNPDNPYAFNLKGATAEVLDEQTVVIRFPEPNGDFLPSGGWIHIVPKAYAEQGEGIMSKHPMGTGPFKFVKQEVGVGFTLERFDDYWGDTAGYETVEFRIIPDPNARVAALRAGEVDVIDTVPPQLVAQLESDPNFKTVAQLTGDSVTVMINSTQKDKPWGDARVRQAMAYAIDQEAIHETVLDGLGARHAGVAPFYDAYEASDLEQYPYDPERAKELLAEAGYPDGFDLPFTTQINGRSPTSEPYAQAVAGYWEAVGIRPQLQTLEFSQWLDELFDLDGALWSLFGSVGTYDPENTLTSGYLCDGSLSNTCDPKLDAMIKDLASIVDTDARYAAISDIFELIHDQAYTIYGYIVESTFAMSKSVDWQPWYGVPFTLMKNAHPAS